MAAAAQVEQQEKKAKMLLIAMFAGGLAVLCGLIYLGSRFLQKTEEDTSGLAEVNAITAKRDKEEAARRQKQDEEIREAENKEAAGEIAQLTKLLSISVCGGDDQVAGELAKELVTIERDLDKAFAEGTMPKNLPAYMEQRLVTRMTENDTLRHWFGKRSPQAFAHAVATTVFGKPNPGGPANDTGAIPSFLASGKYASMGSGFFVSSDGWVLTNQHVVRDAREVDVRLPGGSIKHARVIKTDSSADIALLKADVSETPWLPLSKGDAPMGAGVFTIGFPRPTTQGVEPKFTDGRISSLTGMHDDQKLYQISVPVQSGNSGGPLVHLESGWVVGMIRAKLATRSVEDIPENVNYAIKSAIIRSFVGTVPEAKSVLSTEPILPTSQSGFIDQVKSAIVMVLVEQQ